MSRNTYLDNAATTPVDERVLEAMLPFYREGFGNPNSLYSLGREAHRALEDARERIAQGIGAKETREVIFTGSGTEADNAAVLGIARALRAKGRHVVVSAIEHHAVLEPASRLASEGFDVEEVKPRSDGVVHTEDLEAVLRDDTVLVSVMHVNNELGTIQPIADLARAAHARGAKFHTDAVQGVGKIAFDVEESGVDAASMSAHKMYGPKGVGALYLRRGTPFEALLLGGGQENKRRSGTQNVAGAAGLAAALEIMLAEQESEAARIGALRDHLVAGVLEGIANTSLNGASAPKVPGIANFIVKGVEGESMLLHLDQEGIAISTGSACSSASLDPSHVLLAIGCPPELAHGSLRVSLGRFTTDADVGRFLEVLPEVVARLRAMSPVYEKMFGTSAG